MDVLGIDIGGTGIKGAPVNLETGQLLSKRHRVLTPQPATPEAVIETATALVKYFNWKGPIGCGFPAVIKQGVVHTASNIDASWIGVSAENMMKQATGLPVTFLNDADAAGLAEMHFGAGKDHKGVVIIVTLGTGIGTSLFINGVLVPNTELGHIELEGKDAELSAADSARTKKELSWKKWGVQVNTYLLALEALLWPDLIIIGGGASKKHDRFFPQFTVNTPTVPAQLRNEAGTIGAALAAPTVETPGNR